MAQYAVTGCAGFIGSSLAEALLDSGHTVRGVDCFTPFYPRAVKEANVAGVVGRPGFDLVEADLTQAELEPLVAGVDGVFHLAAQPSTRAGWGEDFDDYAANNVTATKRLLAAASRVGVRLLLASSSSVYGNTERYPTPEDAPLRPVSPYGATKVECERLANLHREQHGADVVVLRLFAVYGPRQRPDMAFARLMTALSEGLPFEVYGDGRQSRDFTYVGDAVAAAIDAMERAPAGRVYNVGRGDEVSLNEAIALCEKLAGRRLDVRYESPAAGDVRRTASDTSLIRSDLGWTPKTPLADGLARQLASVEAQLQASRA